MKQQLSNTLGLYYSVLSPAVSLCNVLSDSLSGPRTQLTDYREPFEANYYCTSVGRETFSLYVRLIWSFSAQIGGSRAALSLG